MVTVLYTVTPGGEMLTIEAYAAYIYLDGLQLRDVATPPGNDVRIPLHLVRGIYGKE